LVRLYTPVDADDAGRLERGEPVGSTLIWVDRVVAEEAEDDAIWMQIDVPEPKLAGSERAVDAALGYREFGLTDAMVQEHRVVRADSP
jgi:hypothetical protein